MKKAHIWVGIWVIVILAPILVIFKVYAPVDKQKVDIVKIGVILPLTSSSTISAQIAEEIKNGLELLPKRPLAANMPPSMVFIYEDSNDDEEKTLELAEMFVKKAGVSAIVSAPVSTSTRLALISQLEKTGVPLIPFGSESAFSCEKEGLNNVGIEEVAALAVFCKTYGQVYQGKVPGYYAAHAFDAGNVLMRALDIQRSDAETKKAIRWAFTARVYKGITGTITFGSKGAL